MLTRRNLIHLAGATGLAITFPSCTKHLPLETKRTSELESDQSDFFGLTASLETEHDYAPEVEGRIPLDLQGTLFRNGPGIFERNGYRKRTILDGDGMIQSFQIQKGSARFRNRFVRTEKYKEENAQGRFLYQSWTTQAPGGFFSNVFAQNMRNDAGVTVYLRNNKLFAFTEGTHPYELDPENLQTIGENDLGVPQAIYLAHSKVDGRTDEWIHCGFEYGADITAHVTLFRKDGSLKNHWKVPLPQYVYMHDFFVTEKHIILHLHPATIGLFDFLSGQTSFAGSFQWKPQRGNTLIVLDRSGQAEPIHLTTEAAYMWHSLNAYDKGDEIIADCVAYENPDHFIGSDPALWAIMMGRKGNAQFPGVIQRYVINPRKRSVQTEVIDSNSHEFPFVNQSLSCHPNRFGYFVRGGGVVLLSGISRADMLTGKTDFYDFGKSFFCGEAVFAPKPGHIYSAGNQKEPGWLLTEVYNDHTKKSFLAIFDAEHLTDGPVAQLHLRHHVPLSFHGNWYEA